MEPEKLSAAPHAEYPAVTSVVAFEGGVVVSMVIVVAAEAVQIVVFVAGVIVVVE